MTVVEVQILDVNDNSPEFQPSPTLSEQAYVVSVEEGAYTLNKTILDINATDKDYGKNAEILYSMAGDPNGYFSIDQISVSDRAVIDICSAQGRYGVE